MARVAIGLRPHTGWAIAVAVDDAGTVLSRARLTMVDDDELRFAWHSSQLRGRTPKEALAYERKVLRLATAAAKKELAALGVEAEAAGIVGIPRELPDAAKILSAHTLLHSAEGELYRAALADAAEALGLAVHHTHPQQADLAGRITAPGRPWSKDHREAAAAALDALH